MSTSATEHYGEGDRPLKECVTETGTHLRRAFQTLLTATAPQGVRPATLARMLDIDKTLAARLLRALRADDPLRVVYESPAPPGLRIIVEASRAAGVDRSTLAKAERAATQLEQAMAAIPGGRGTLQATIAGWRPELRQRSDHAARQNNYRAMSQILGHEAELLLNTIAIAPSADSDRCDALQLYGSVGLRRLQAGASISVMGVDEGQLAPNNDQPLQIEPLEHYNDAITSTSFLMREFCSEPLPPFRTARRGPFLWHVLPEQWPDLGERVTLIHGQLSRNELLRYRTNDICEEFVGVISRMPYRMMHTDVLLHRDVFPHAVPSVTSRLHAFSFERPRRDDQVDRLALHVPVETVSHDALLAPLPEYEAYGSLLRRALDRAGWPVDAFRAFRWRFAYPTPFTEMITWLTLPEPPNGDP